MTAPLFRGKRSLGLRLWHWSNSALMLAIVATVWLRDELVDVRGHSKLFVERLGAQGVTVTPDQARELALTYKDTLWDWHMDLGLALLALLAARLVVEFVSADKLCRKIKDALAKGDKDSRMFAAVKLSHAAFYAGLAVALGTGVVTAYGKGWGVPDGLRHGVKEVHEWMMYALLAFIAAHVIGVVRAEKTTDPGLVSDMIHGG